MREALPPTNLYLMHDIPTEASMSEESFPFQVHGVGADCGARSLPVRHRKLGFDDARS